MPKISYIDKTFSASSRALIDHANRIIEEYALQGYDLTLRQLYYQFVSRDLIANNMREYKRIGNVVNDARLAGKIDWLRLVDRTRSLRTVPTWSSPASILQSSADCFALDKWREQSVRVEVWVEKDALSGVFGRVCDELQLPLFACKGYTSQSEMWAAARRLEAIIEGGQTPIILHFGDHDPSGMDMSRDIRDRLRLFMGGVRLERMALNMEQVEEYGPPPNPAKVTDSRADAYIAEYGEESWELDALPPDTLAGLVRDFVLAERDETKWTASQARENEGRERLEGFAALCREEDAND